MEITQTLLPGVGMRYDMTTARGVPLSVVVHREGQADLHVRDRDDPDDVRFSLALGEDEVDSLAEVLGAARIALHAGSPYAGHPLGATKARTLTGCSIVAVVRDDDVIAAPGPDTRLEAGDSLVAVGSAAGLDQLRVRLQPS